MKELIQKLPSNIAEVFDKCKDSKVGIVVVFTVLAYVAYEAIKVLGGQGQNAEKA
jgi:hypothetical protein